MSKQLKQATTLYSSFREADPQKLIRLMVDIPRVCAAIGHIEAVEYRTTHGGKLELYRHDFQKGSRPLLCSSGDGKQLLLLGGHYKFTDRGIVDRDAKGKLIYDPKHGRAINPKSPSHKFTQAQFAKYVKIFQPSRALQRKAIALIKHDRVGWAKAGFHRLFQAAEAGKVRSANPARAVNKAVYGALPKAARELALRHRVNLGRDEHGNYFIRAGGEIVATSKSAKPTAANALALVRRYVLSRQSVAD